MAKTVTVKAATLVRDLTVYPRHTVDDTHIRELVRALEAGHTLPPVIAELGTRRQVDGIHRTAAVLRHFGADAEIEVQWRTYASDADLLEEAIRLNAGHGRRLAPYDKARCIALAEDIGLTPDRTAAAMGMTVERMDDLRLRKTAIGPGAGLIPIKATSVPYAGRPMSAAQVTGNHRAGGMGQTFYVNQVINLIESDLLDTSNARLMERLAHLMALLLQTCGVASSASVVTDEEEVA